MEDMSKATFFNAFFSLGKQINYFQSKFNKLTPLSKTLQEDPSNQLLTVLRKYLHKHGTDQVERAVSVETVPQLITVQKGILALMRQWKNVLYMPNLGQVNFKVRPSFLFASLVYHFKKKTLKIL